MPLVRERLGHEKYTGGPRLRKRASRVIDGQLFLNIISQEWHN